jgi:hypothetical protein
VYAVARHDLGALDCELPVLHSRSPPHWSGCHVLHPLAVPLPQSGSLSTTCQSTCR